MNTRRRKADDDADGHVTPAGAGYVAMVRLRTKASAGDRRTVLAVPGETCERVPDSSLPWLIAQGLIVPAPQGGE